MLVGTGDRLTSGHMLTVGYQRQHRLLHLDVSAMSHCILLFAVLHRFVDFRLEVVGLECANDLHEPGVNKKSGNKQSLNLKLLTLKRNFLLQGFAFGPFGSGR